MNATPADKRIALREGNAYHTSMTTVQDIKVAIQHLPGNQFSEIHDWIVERDWEDWDAQIERDSDAGKLDFLIDEARRHRESGNTRPL